MTFLRTLKKNFSSQTWPNSKKHSFFSVPHDFPSALQSATNQTSKWAQKSILAPKIPYVTSPLNFTSPPYIRNTATSTEEPLTHRPTKRGYALGIPPESAGKSSLNTLSARLPTRAYVGTPSLAPSAMPGRGYLQTRVRPDSQRRPSLNTLSNRLPTRAYVGTPSLPPSAMPSRTGSQLALTWELPVSRQVRCPLQQAPNSRLRENSQSRAKCDARQRVS